MGSNSSWCFFCFLAEYRGIVARQKKVKVEPLPLFPIKAPDPLPVPLKEDRTEYITGWICLRCLEPKESAYRTLLVFFSSDGKGGIRESDGLTVCTTCKAVIEACLQNQTCMTPIHNPPSLVENKVEPEEPRLHPWEV